MEIRDKNFIIIQEMEIFIITGDMLFIRREYEHKNKRCDSNGDYVIYLQSGKYC